MSMGSLASIGSYTANTTGDRLYPITIQIQNKFGGYTPVRALSDSVTGDVMMYWKIDNELKYGTMEDLFCSYTANKDNHKYQILSARRNPKAPKPPYQKPVMTTNNIEICFSDIKDVSYHGIKPVWKVTLRNGKTIKITKDHSVFCAESYQKEMKAVTLDELDNVISIDDYNIQQEKPIAIEDDMLTFMGLWIADGSYQKDGEYKTGVRISTGGEKNILKWLEDFSIGYSDKIGTSKNEGQQQVSCLKYSKSRHGDVYISRRQLVTQLYSLMGDVDSYTKRVPKEIFLGTNEQIALFLKGYFSGDGSIHICNNNPKCESFKYGSYYSVDCASVNRELLEDISILLDRLGIKHNISTPYKQSKTGYKTDKLQYKLIIHASPSVNKFMEKVGFIKAFKFKKRETYKRDKKLRPVSLRDIRSIELIGPEPVYDISVEETEAFIANGILCHNTGNEISIFKREVADELGLNMDEGQHFKVAGINGQGREFRRFKLMVKIGTLQPVQATIGFAMNKGDLVENLLGNADVLKSGKFQVTYDKDTVTYTQKALNARVSSCDSYGSEQEILNQLYDHLTTRRKRHGKSHTVSDDMKDGGGHNSISAYGVFF